MYGWKLWLLLCQNLRFHSLRHDRLFWRDSPQGAKSSSFTRFLDHTRHTTVGRNPLDYWSVRRRDLWLNTQNSRQTSMPPVGSDPTISAGQRLKTDALDRAATGLCVRHVILIFMGFRTSKVSDKGRKVQYVNAISECNLRSLFVRPHRQWLEQPISACCSWIGRG
jgi:hypothetical protein